MAILVRSLGLKKSMKELDYPPNFWNIVYWDVLDFSKKIWSLGAPPPMRPGPLEMAKIRHLGGPGPHRGWGPLTPKFFWELQEVPIDSVPKSRWVVQLLHGYF